MDPFSKQKRFEIITDSISSPLLHRLLLIILNHVLTLKVDGRRSSHPSATFNFPCYLKMVINLLLPHYVTTRGGRRLRRLLS